MRANRVPVCKIPASPTPVENQAFAVRLYNEDSGCVCGCRLDDPVYPEMAC